MARSNWRLWPAPQARCALWLTDMADTAGQWRALIDCYGQHRRRQLGMFDAILVGKAMATNTVYLSFDISNNNVCGEGCHPKNAHLCGSAGKLGRLAAQAAAVVALQARCNSFYFTNQVATASHCSIAIAREAGPVRLSLVLTRTLLLYATSTLACGRHRYCCHWPRQRPPPTAGSSS